MHRTEQQPRGALVVEGLLKRFVADEAGATAIEYGLLAAGIAVAITSSVNQLGCDLANVFGNVASSIQAQ
jgi:pilus assembly protein Flp/PilA